MFDHFACQAGRQTWSRQSGIRLVILAVVTVELLKEAAAASGSLKQRQTSQPTTWPASSVSDRCRRSWRLQNPAKTSLGWSSGSPPCTQGLITQSWFYPSLPHTWTAGRAGGRRPASGSGSDGDSGERTSARRNHHHHHRGAAAAIPATQHGAFALLCFHLLGMTVQSQTLSLGHLDRRNEPIKSSSLAQSVSQFRVVVAIYVHTVLLCDDIHARTNTLMILPQVHLRKPCYDFYFL